MSETSDRQIAFAGCTEPGFELLCHLVEEGYEIAEIVSLRPEQGDRYGVSGYYSYEAFASDQDIPIFYPEEYGMKDDEYVDHFEALDADLLVVHGWQRLIPGEILSTFTHGALGVHGSAFGLPKGRGRSPMNWSLIENLDRFLLSVIKLDADVDSGKIVGTKKFDITNFDTIETLYYKLVMVTAAILDESLEPLFEGTLELEPQEGEETYYPKRTPEDGAIHWEDPTRTIYNLIRAVAAPYPGAFTEQDGQRIKIWQAIPFSDDLAFDADPGTIVQHFVTTGDFVVATADGTLLVTDWEAEDWTPEEGTVLNSLPNDSIGSPNRVDRPEHHENLSG